MNELIAGTEVRHEGPIPIPPSGFHDVPLRYDWPTDAEKRQEYVNEIFGGDMSIILFGTISFGDEIGVRPPHVFCRMYDGRGEGTVIRRMPNEDFVRRDFDANIFTPCVGAGLNN
ncbi:MAG: hypothetical protein O3C49_07285 [Proteobacteria bacterium]|nr:hypothetical protein [Pseudomonadota bacterium]